MPKKIASLFSGCGGLDLGFTGGFYFGKHYFERLNTKIVFANDFDQDAYTCYNANHLLTKDGVESILADIRDVEVSEIPDFDILLAGFPCQPFSNAGNRKGVNDTSGRGTLFAECERVIRGKIDNGHRPQAFVFENVRGILSSKMEDNVTTVPQEIEKRMNLLGYDVSMHLVCASDYGVPQKRERIIIVGFKDNVLFSFPDPVPVSKRKKLTDILEQDVSDKYYVRDEIKESRLMRLKDPNYPKPYISHENMAGSITPHPYSSCLRAGASANYILINDERRPTEREMLRLQGFPDDFKFFYDGVNDGYKMIGNAVPVNLAFEVATAIRQQLGGVS